MPMKLNLNKFEHPAYWIQNIQYSLNALVNKYLHDNDLNRSDFANKLGVSKGYVSQILNGEFDHKLSKMVELALACGMVPKFEFVPISMADQVVQESYLAKKNWHNYRDFFNAMNIQGKKNSEHSSFVEFNKYKSVS